MKDANRNEPVTCGANVAADIHGHPPVKSSDTWLFNTEAVSTLLISLWFIIETLARLGIIPHGQLYDWIAASLVSILFDIFYFGTGYIFQEHQRVNDVRSWKKYFRRESVILLAPCIAFTLLSLITGSAIAATQGMAASGIVPPVLPFTPGNVIDAFIVHPAVSMGYFIVLVVFFVFMRTPQTAKGINALLACAALAKAAAILLADTGLAAQVPIVVMQLLRGWIWLVLGVATSFYRLPQKMANPKTGIACVVAFLALCVVFYLCRIEEAFAVTMLSVVGVAAFYSVCAACFLGKGQVGFFGFVGQYTMAIWLMHPIITELVFCGMFALGLSPATLAPLYAVVCVVCCYVLPILVLMLLNRIGKLGFIVYPARYLPQGF